MSVCYDLVIWEKWHRQRLLIILISSHSKCHKEIITFKILLLRCGIERLKHISSGNLYRNNSLDVSHYNRANDNKNKSFFKQRDGESAENAIAVPRSRAIPHMPR